MNNCTLSLDGIYKEIHRKVPSIFAFSHTKLEIYKTNFKGDTTNDADTAGIFILEGDADIK